MKNLTSFIRNTIKRFVFNYCSRQKLLTLDENSLRDIGLTFIEAKKEGKKPFWKEHSEKSKYPF